MLASFLSRPWQIHGPFLPALTVVSHRWDWSYNTKLSRRKWQFIKKADNTHMPVPLSPKSKNIFDRVCNPSEVSPQWLVKNFNIPQPSLPMEAGEERHHFHLDLKKYCSQPGFIRQTFDPPTTLTAQRKATRKLYSYREQHHNEAILIDTIFRPLKNKKYIYFRTHLSSMWLIY